MRFKLGLATFTAGITEPSLSVVTEVDSVGPLRPPHPGSKKKEYQYPVPLRFFGMKSVGRGMQARAAIATSEILPQSCLHCVRKAPERR